MKRNLFSSLYFVSGSWPPSICGVGDYMDNLASAIETQGNLVRRVTLGKYDVFTALRLVAQSGFMSCGLVYLSYPTEGYGKSLLPFLFCFGSRTRIVIHLHEYKSKNVYARFLIRLFRFKQHLFFSNTSDRERYIIDCGLSGNSARTQGWQVLPTPSNIPVVVQRSQKPSQQPIRILHFGQIRPFKGLEQLAQLFMALKIPSVDLVLLGGVPAGYEVYAESVMRLFAEAGARVRLNATRVELSQELSHADIGVFLFPDGADERRGSLIAAMEHGLLCVTTYSDKTPDVIKQATIGLPVSTGDFDVAGFSRLIHDVVIHFSDVDHVLRRQRAVLYGQSVNFARIAEIVAGVQYAC